MGQTYVGADKSGLVELTRVYSQPITFDFSDAFEIVPQEHGKDKIGFDLTTSIDPANNISPVDKGVRIGKNILQSKRTFPPNHLNDLENVSEKKACFAPSIDSPEFQKCLFEL